MISIIKNKKFLLSLFMLLFNPLYGVKTLKEQAAQAYFCNSSLKQIKENLENNKLNQELQETLVQLIRNKYKEQLDPQFNKILKDHTDWITSVALSSDGHYSVTGSRDGTVYLYARATGESTLIFEHADPIISVAFGFNNKCLLIGLKSEVRLFDLINNKITKTLICEDSTDSLTSVALSSDSKYVITGSQDRTARLWDLKTGKTVKILRHTDTITSIALSKDGKYALIGAEDSTVLLWNLTTYETKILKGHRSSITSVAFSKNSEQALTGSEDATVRLWDLATGDSKIFVEYTHEVTSIATDASGKYALIGSSDNAYIYNLETGEIIITLAYHTDIIKSVAFSPDGKYALTGSFDTSVCLWDLDYILNKIRLKEIINRLFH